MKKIFVLVFVLLISLRGITQAPDPQVEKLVVNSSPAFILLGVQPDNIQRPSTPRDFIGCAQSGIVNKKLQPNFALETNPFNWNKKSNGNRFYARDFFYKGSEAVKKNFAMSLATSETDTVIFGKLKPSLGFSYGLRITLLPGKVNKQIAEAFMEWEKIEINSVFLNLLRSQMMLGATNFSDGQIDGYINQVVGWIKSGIVNGTYVLGDNIDEEVETFKTYASSFKGMSDANFAVKFNAERGVNMADKNAQIGLVNAINQKTVPFERQGFILEVACGGITALQNNQWAESHFAKFAAWITPSYRFHVTDKQDPDNLTESFDLMGVFRYFVNDRKVDTANYTDFGIKGQYNRHGWNASLEWTARHASRVPINIKSNWTNCWLASFSYTLNESATFKFTLGSNFDGNTRTYYQEKDFFIAGGINLGIFGKE